MRTAGLIFAILGGFVIYLGISGKAGRAWWAIRTGEYVGKTLNPNTPNIPAHPPGTVPGIPGLPPVDNGSPEVNGWKWDPIKGIWIKVGLPDGGML